jgi:hypothetical protein
VNSAAEDTSRGVVVVVGEREPVGQVAGVDPDQRDREAPGRDGELARNADGEHGTCGTGDVGGSR